MSKLRIYVDFAMPPEARELLQKEAQPHELAFSRPSGGEGADPGLQEADVAFGQPDPQALAEAPSLKWVQISSSGITRYDNEAFRSAMKERGIAVCNSASVFNEPCAAHVLGFMLAQARLLPRALQARDGFGSDEWSELRNGCVDLREQTAVLVGYGAIAKRLAEMLAPFSMNLVACRRNPRGDEGMRTLTPDELADVLPSCDHVVDVLPESEETRGFFDSQCFTKCKPGAIFYNIGRGATVDQGALLSALQSGRIAAAWLDVTDPEPLPADHPLRSEPSCHITPHVAGGHRCEALSVVRHFLSNLNRLAKKEPLQDRVM